MSNAIHRTCVKKGEPRLPENDFDFTASPSPNPLEQPREQHSRGTHISRDLFLRCIQNPTKYQEDFKNLPPIICDAQRQDILQVYMEDRKVFCRICKISSAGIKILITHLQTDKHKKMFESYKSTASSSPVETSSLPANLSQSSGAIAEVTSGHESLQSPQSSTSFSRKQVSSDPSTQQASATQLETAVRAKVNSKHTESRKKAPGASNKILSPGSTDRSNTAYKLQSRPRGVVLVFNYVFKGQNNVRLGAEKDGKNIREVFEKMNYEVHLFPDYTKENTMKTFSDWTRTQKLENVDSFIAFFLSHGGSTSADEFDTFDKEKISVHEIYSMLSDTKCPNLRDKPKLLFFNFCRGSTEQIHTDDDDSWKPGKKTEAPKDLALVYATLPYYKAKRNSKTGTYFVKNLCRVLREHDSHMDLVTIIYETSELMKMEKVNTPIFSVIHFKKFYFHGEDGRGSERRDEEDEEGNSRRVVECFGWRTITSCCSRRSSCSRSTTN